MAPTARDASGSAGPDLADSDDGAGRPEGRSHRLTSRAILSEIAAGVTVAMVALPFCVSAGVLAYEPFGRDYTATGAATGILCAVAGGVVATIGRHSSFVVTVPSVAMALIQASFVSGLLATFDGDAPRVIALMPFSIVLAGLWQVLFAWSGLARAVKFTPYPVLAGFVTGLAVLTFAQQAPRFFDAVSLGSLVKSLARGEVPPLVLPLFGFGILALIRLSERYAPRLPGMLVGLIGGTLAWHLVEAVWPDLGLGRTIGALSLGQACLGLHLEAETVMRLMTDMTVIQAVVFTSLTIAALGTLDFTFSLRAAQNLYDLPASPRRDLAAQGLANAAAGFTGGIAVTPSIGLSTTNFESGGRTRLSSIAYGLVLLMAVFAAPGLISSLPIVVLAAILLSIAWKLWDRWCLTLIRDAFWATAVEARIRARRNAAIVVAVMAATILGQPVVGALVGVLLSCLVFIIEMSRPIVRRRLTGEQLSSKRIRSQGDRALLAAQGGRILVLDLQGVLFFGNADDLASEIKASEKSVDTVVLDLRRVTDLDTSGATVLQHIARRCDGNRIRLMIAAPDAKYRDLLREAIPPGVDATLYQDIDVALEEAENLLLAAAGAKSARATLRLTETDLAAGLSEAELSALSRRVTVCSYAVGTFLCRADEPADKLWILARGSVSIRISGNRWTRRIAGVGPGTAVGELGLIDRRPRSADVVADEDVEAYVLAAEDFDILLRDEPHLGQSLLATIARLTAQRLRAASDELRLADM